MRKRVKSVSADNGIYILKTKDQYRVAHLRAIDNVFWSYAGDSRKRTVVSQNRLVPTRVVEMWGGCKFTRSREKALKIAYRWAGRLPVCEYGVKIVSYNKKWKDILKDAKEYARKESEFIKGHGNEK
ncbi:MAG: hypothetical protein HDT13_06830 [Butyrivibrio sp.]|nr:hypothetical protein [Butyrivibrio sp.]